MDRQLNFARFIRKDNDMGTAAQQAYPPSMKGRFIVGHDAYGHWVVCDRQGMTGGLFTDRVSAMHFAVTESDHAPDAVSVAPDDAVLSLWPNADIGSAGESIRRAA